MQIEKLPITQLKPAPYNPRLKLTPGSETWNKLERSLDEFHLVQPIVWNSQTGHVVSGHQRLAILKHRGVDAVECAIVNLTLEKEKALNVTLNNQAIASDWDATKLVDLVSELQDLPEFDATLTGFNEQELKDLVLSPNLEIQSVDASEPNLDITRVTLEIPNDLWNDVQHSLDELLQSYPNVRLHVNA